MSESYYRYVRHQDMPATLSAGPWLPCGSLETCHHGFWSSMVRFLCCCGMVP